MCFFHANDIYVAVNTAIEGKIRYLRIHFLVGGVVH